MAREQGKRARSNGANGKRRQNGTGTIERRGDRWLARWTVRNPQGAIVRRSETIRPNEELDSGIPHPVGSVDWARARLRVLTEGNALLTQERELKKTAERLAGVKAELARIEDEKPALALADGFEAYRASRERPDTGAATMDMYESQYTRLVRWVAANAPEVVEMRHLTRATAERFMDYLAGELSTNSYNKYLTLFTRVWKVLEETARITANPWEKIRPKSVQSFTRRELTIEELRRVCGSVEGEMRTLFAIGIYTGLRLGDCALLDWGAVDMVRGMISTIPHKTARHAHGKPVVIPLHPALAAILSETPTEARTGFVVPGLAEKYSRDSASVTDTIQRIFTGCGIRTTEKDETDKRARVVVGFHSLRHTFVSMAANAGAPLALIQSIVGHSNPTMTRHYYHESETALKNAVAALPDVNGDNAPTDEAATMPGVPCAFCAALDEMTREQLEAAKAEIEKRLASFGPM